LSTASLFISCFIFIEQFHFSLIASRTCRYSFRELSALFTLAAGQALKGFTEEELLHKNYGDTGPVTMADFLIAVSSSNPIATAEMISSFDEFTSLHGTSIPRHPSDDLAQLAILATTSTLSPRALLKAHAKYMKNKKPE